jgi:23S rRNA (cytosine1962-C5)-methyltransferase
MERRRERIAVTCPERLAGHVLKGHPWLYAEALPRGALGGVPTGTIVMLRGVGGKLLGYALYDADSPIALRVLGTRHDAAPGPVLWRDRVDAAWKLRRRVIDQSHTNAFRLIHGEGDRIPGVVVDRYAGFLVMKLDTPAWLPHLGELVEAITAVVAPDGIYFKGLVGRGSGEQGGRAAAEPRILAGSPPPENLEVSECGMRLAVDVYRGQKTGLFLDQRENRALIRQVARDSDVLNLYSYTGGFSLAALFGGARHVVSVDTAGEAMRAARENFVLNGFDPERHDFVVADAVEFLKRCAQERRQFDLVIVDPPSLAMREDAVAKASRAYVNINERALRQVRPGGLFATASCSSHMTLERFIRALREAAAAARKPLRVLQIRGEPPDHPTPLHFPEGHYLKFVLGQVD